MGVLALVGYPFLAQSVAAPGTVTSIIIIPSQVNISSSAATVSVNLGSTVTGFNWGVVSFSSPSGVQQLYGILVPVGNGMFQASVNVAQDAEVGVWHINSITLMNGTSNRASLSYADVTALGLQASLTVSAQLGATPHLPTGKLGVYRSAGTFGLWVFDTNGSGVFEPSDKTTTFGLASDYPVVGDWNGTGVQSIGVCHCAASGVTQCAWYIDLNNNGVWDGVAGGDAIWIFGIPGDTPVVGDWTGDGKSKIGVFRCTAGLPECQWFLDLGNKRTWDAATAGVYRFGLPGDRPAPGNWSGSAADQVGVMHCTTAGAACTWIVDSLGRTGILGFNAELFDPGDRMFSFTGPGGFVVGDVPVVGNWNGNGTKRAGVFRTSTGVWYVDTNGNGTLDPPDQIFTNFSLPGDRPVVGNWLQ